MAKYRSSLVLANQSLACEYLVLVTCWCFSQGVFLKSFVYISFTHLFEATSPLLGAGGVVFEVYFWWVSNGAPRRPLDASKGRPSLTSYNGIVSAPLWPRPNFAKKWLRQIDQRLLHLLNLTLHMKHLYLLNAVLTTICKYRAPSLITYIPYLVDTLTLRISCAVAPSSQNVLSACS
jgi:hypothetical protein